MTQETESYDPGDRPDQTKFFTEAGVSDTFANARASMHIGEYIVTSEGKIELVPSDMIPGNERWRMPSRPVIPKTDTMPPLAEGGSEVRRDGQGPWPRTTAPPRKS